MNYQQVQHRKWRTLVRCEGFEDDNILFIIPAWSAHEIVKVHKSSVPNSLLLMLSKGYRTHVHVNIGSHTKDNLKFDKWELE